MRSRILLPHLLFLSLISHGSCNKSDNSLDTIVSTAPNLLNLMVGGELGSYQGPLFTSHLHNLKKFTIFGTRSIDVVEGKLWPIREFRGLQMLDVERNPSSVAFPRFFDVIAPTLTDLKIPFTFPYKLFDSLEVSQRMEVHQLRNDELILSLPDSITHLKVSLFKTSTSEKIQLSSWNLLKYLSILEINNLEAILDFDNLPPLKLLKINDGYEETVVKSLKTVNKVKFGELVLGGKLNPDFVSPYSYGDSDSISIEREAQAIALQAKCQELNINLRFV